MITRRITAVSSEISQIPKVPVDADAETAGKVMRLMENLDDHDDVQNVYGNYELSDALMAKLG